MDGGRPEYSHFSGHAAWVGHAFSVPSERSSDAPACGRIFSLFLNTTASSLPSRQQGPRRGAACTIPKIVAAPLVQNGTPARQQRHGSRAGRIGIAALMRGRLPICAPVGYRRRPWQTRGVSTSASPLLMSPPPSRGTRDIKADGREAPIRAATGALWAWSACLPRSQPMLPGPEGTPSRLCLAV